MTGNATVSLSSAASLNQPIGDWITIHHTPGYRCTRQSLAPSRALTMFGITPPATAMGTFITVDGLNFRILIPPGQPNIGYIVRTKSSVTSNIWNQTTPTYSSILGLGLQILGGIFRHAPTQGPIPNQYNFSMEVQVRLVKTSPSWPSNGDSVTFDALLSALDISIGGVAGPAPPPLNYPTYTARANVTFSVFTPTCTTPSLADSGNTVSLGGVYNTILTGPGSAAPSVPFTMRVNCTAGFNQGVKYRFLACPSCTTPPPNSTLNLNNSATASGVGVQVLHGDDTTPLSFNSNYTLTNYDNATGGQYDIPLRAKIIQTCATTNCVSPGSVRASMIMHMVYP